MNNTTIVNEISPLRFYCFVCSYVMQVLSNHASVEVDTSVQGLIESRVFSIHGCVHAWTRSVLNQIWDQDPARLAVKFVGSHVPGEETVRP